MKYGFRLYSVSLREGKGRTPKPWSGDGWAYLAHVKEGLDLIEKAQQPDTEGDRPAPLSLWYSRRDVADLTELPESPMAPGADREARVGRLVSTSVDRHSLTLELRMGYVGAFEASIGPKRDRPMEREAPSHDFRAHLVVPKDASDGLLAVEAVGRNAPVGAVECLLALASRQVGWAAEPAEGLPPAWWGLSAHQATDPQFFQKLLDSDETEVHLQRITHDDQGKRKAVDRHLVARGLDRAERDRLRVWARLAGKQRQSLGTRGLVKILGYDDDALNDLDMNDGYVRIGDDDTMAKVRMGDVLDKFTYRIKGRERPTGAAWLEAVRERMSVLDDTLEGLH
ncbi:hypothetical protein ACSDQ9_05810 [Aestuariimicrobium soli]|uniref:hypothetical protein n=1 Tax=Aestuariimicrobium soli TaxID=2035834 RepID=UPI003EB9677D